MGRTIVTRGILRRGSGGAMMRALLPVIILLVVLYTLAR